MDSLDGEVGKDLGREQESMTAQCNRGKPAYRDASLQVGKRVTDLLGRMTLEEKIGQLYQLCGWNAYVKQGRKAVVSREFEEILSGSGIGSLYGVLRADPWTQVTLETGLARGEGAEIVNALQRFAIDNTRLGIPLVFGEECPHGHVAIGATVFPAPISVASTWDPGLCERMAAAISAETRAQGATLVEPWASCNVGAETSTTTPCANNSLLSIPAAIRQVSARTSTGLCSGVFSLAR